MVMRGEIKDGKTIAGILKLKALLERGQAVNILYEDNAHCGAGQACGAVQRGRVCPAALRQLLGHSRMPLWGWCTGWTPACPA